MEIDDMSTETIRKYLEKREEAWEIMSWSDGSWKEKIISPEVRTHWDGANMTPLNMRPPRGELPDSGSYEFFTACGYNDVMSLWRKRKRDE